MSDDTGPASLERQLTALESTLSAFDDPVGLQLPGMRLMQEALLERAGHVRQTLEKARTAALEVTVSGEVVRDGRVEAAFLVGLLGALDDAVQATGVGLEALAAVDQPARGAAVRLHLAAVEPADGRVTIRLQEPPVDPDARLRAGAAGAAETAIDDVLAALEGDGSDGDAGEALRRVAALVAGRAVRVELALLRVDLEPRVVSLTRSRAQRWASPAAA